MDKRTLQIEEDSDGNLVLPFGDLMYELQWEVGDTVVWVDNGDGSWTLEKK